MSTPDDRIVVGLLGQWASGKSTAAKTLVNYLGGAERVTFITDREQLARQAVLHILNLDENRIKRSETSDGKVRLEGELATVYLDPCEALETVDLNMLLFDLDKAVYDCVPVNTLSWMDKARLEMGREILIQASSGKPIVIEAGFGTNTESRGENPFRNAIADLFDRLDEAGVKAGYIKWIIIEASYKTRSVRNRLRPDSVPTYEFDRFAADGGDLDPEQQRQLEASGAIFKRVPNNHDNVERFKTDIIAVFEDLFAK